MTYRALQKREGPNRTFSSVERTIELWDRGCIVIRWLYQAECPWVNAGL